MAKPSDSQQPDQTAWQKLMEQHDHQRQPLPITEHVCNIHTHYHSTRADAGHIAHLVQTTDHLLHSQGESQKGMLTGLAILGDTSLETSRGGIDNEHSAVSLQQSIQLSTRSFDMHMHI
jgi:hypothetical protein